MFFDSPNGDGTKYTHRVFTWEMEIICAKYGENFNLMMFSYNLCVERVETDFWYQFLKIE